MPLEEGFLALGGEGYDERAPRVTQPHDKQLHGHAFLRAAGDAFTPVRLGIGPGIELQGQIDGALLSLLPTLRHIPPHGGLTAGIALRLQQGEDLVSRIALLPWHARILGQQPLDHRLVGPQDRGQPGLPQGVGLWRCGLDGLLHAGARAPQLTGNLPNRFVLLTIGPSDLFAGFHCDHLLLRNYAGSGAPQHNSGRVIQWPSFR